MPHDIMAALRGKHLTNPYQRLLIIKAMPDGAEKAAAITGWNTDMEQRRAELATLASAINGLRAELEASKITTGEE